MREPELLQPSDLAALAGALRQSSARSRLLAGGTDLMLQLRQSPRQPDLVIDLSRVDGLQGIWRDGARMHIGAMTRFDAMACDPSLRASAACLAQAAASVGSVQIRSMATLGGNVANASPCADSVPALLALDADVGVLAADGRVQRRALAQVLEQAGGQGLAHDEALVDFSFDCARAPASSGFAKLGARLTVTMAKLNAAIVLGRDAPGASVQWARVAFGALARSARLDAHCAQVLVGRRLDQRAIEDFAAACTAMLDRPLAQRPSWSYKRVAIRGLAHDLLAALH